MSYLSTKARRNAESIGENKAYYAKAIAFLSVGILIGIMSTPADTAAAKEGVQETGGHPRYKKKRQQKNENRHEKNR